MDVDVNYVAIIVATIAAMVIGGVWYAPPVFGDTWGKLVSLDEAKAKKVMPIAMLLMLAGAFLKAFMLAHMIGLSNYFYNHSYFHDSMGTVFAIFIGFILVHVVTRNVFEQRPFKLTLIILGNELVTLTAMGAIIGVMGI